MGKEETIFERFLAGVPKREESPSWDECGRAQRAFRQKGGQRIIVGNISSKEISKAITSWSLSAKTIMERSIVGLLARRVDALEAEVKLLRRVTRSVIVPIETFAPYPFEVVNLFHVVVEPVDGEFEANLYDANIGASGDTQTEAIENLKDIMVNLFEHYSKADEKKLGPGPAAKWAILKTLLKKRV
jgi:hypothetical protein